MQACNCKRSTLKALGIMREEAHIYTCRRGAHPRSQSKNKQMKSTENFDDRKTVSGMILTTKEAGKTSEGIF